MKAKKNKDGLLPCPFCGRYPAIAVYVASGIGIHYSIECNRKSCGVLPWTGMRSRKASVIKIWNKRA